MSSMVGPEAAAVAGRMPARIATSSICPDRGDQGARRALLKRAPEGEGTVEAPALREHQAEK